MMQRRKTLLGTGTILAVALSAVPVLALGAPNVHADTVAPPQAGTSLAGTHLHACQNRQAAINAILGRIVTRGQNQLDLFSAIAQRVETFKTNKNVTVADYDQLLATLQADKTKAAGDLQVMQSNSTLDCAGSNPRGVVSAFRGDLQQEISDLKTYKTAVKNLIVAVKTAVASTTSGSASNAGGDK